MLACIYARTAETDMFVRTTITNMSAPWSVMFIKDLICSSQP